MILLSFLALAFAAPSEGRWLKLFEEADESTFLDLSGLKRGADSLVWIRHDYPRARADGTRSVKDQWHVSCRERSCTIYAMISYDRGGRVISARAIPADQRHAAPLVPGSRMERVFSAVCGKTT